MSSAAPRGTLPRTPASAIPPAVSERLQRWSFWLLLAVVFTAPLGSNIHVPGHPSLFPSRLLMASFVLVEAARVALCRKWRPRPDLLGPAVLLPLLCVWGAASIAWSVNRAAALRYVIFLLQWTVLVSAIASYGRDRRRLRLISVFAFASFLAVTAGAMYERATGFHFPESMLSDPEMGTRYFYLFTSVFHNPNDLATFLTLWSPLLLLGYLEGGKLRFRLPFLALFVLASFLIASSLSRANTLAVAAAVAVVLGFTAKRRLVAWALLPVAAAVAFLLLPPFPRIFARQAIHNLVTDIRSGAISSDERASLTAEAMQLLRQSRGLGVGAGNVETRLRQLRGEDRAAPGEILNMHNWWMEVLVNLGLVGSGLYVSFYGWLLVVLFRAQRRLDGRDRAAAALALGTGAALVGFALGCVSSSSVLTFSPIWLFFGLAAASSQLAPTTPPNECPVPQ